MNLSDRVKNITGILTVEIQGFFTERFINLCKINNIKIWNIRNIVNGVIRFNIHIKDFKKLKKVARKTKCIVKIKRKKGIYFQLFKYRNRKILAHLLIILILIFTITTCFIWKIEITGNNRVSNEEIKTKLNESGIYIGRLKLGMDKNNILKSLRPALPEVAWVGLEIKGIQANVKIVEKVILENKNIQDKRIGDIIADKEGVITRIIPENGTPGYKEGSYVLKGYVLIEGKIYSNILEEELVHAKGIIKMNTEYIFEKEYGFTERVKEYTGKSKYNIGFSVNSKEFYVNYLKNSEKYDKLKSQLEFKLFGNVLSLDWYVFNEYIEKDIMFNKEEILLKAKIDSDKYIEDIIKELDSGNLIDEKEEIFETSENIKFKKTFIVNEKVGEFMERIE